MQTRRFYFLAGAITVLALLAREWFVLVAQVHNPLGGDAAEYVAYARNLLGGFFGIANSPDAYRTPGYPLMVMGSMLEAGDWHTRLLQWQVLLGAATVVVVMAATCIWAPRGWALLAGLLMALQPHNIAASGEVLSEVLFGFVLVCALWCTATAVERRSPAWSTCAGIAFGLAYLVNPLIALFPLIVAWLFWRIGSLRCAAALLATALIFVCAWSLRSTHVGGHGSQRAYVNFVQGSWPLYHAAYNSRNADPEPARIIRDIGTETVLLQSDHAAGLDHMRARMAEAPLQHATWYASKVFLVWDWDIRIGAGGPYVHSVSHSPLDTYPLFRATTAASKMANPWVFLLAFGAAIASFWRRAKLALPALLFLYLTAVHVVLQAEPRYSTPYRGIELSLAVSALAYVASRMRGPGVEVSSVTGTTEGVGERKEHAPEFSDSTLLNGVRHGGRGDEFPVDSTP